MRSDRTEGSRVEGSRVERRALRGLLVTALLFSAWPTTPAILEAGARQPLDGRTFQVERGKKGSTHGTTEEFVFMEGRFHSSTGAAAGFKDAEYSSTAAGDMITFQARAESYREGTMTWDGTVIGDSIRGTSVWTRNEHPVEFWFRGTLKR
jgi:hypothetical protein